MKRTGKKLLAFLLATTMVFSFAACGKKTDDTSSNATTPTVAPQAAATEAPAATTAPTAAPEKYAAFDFGGRTIKVGIWWDYFYTSDHKDIKDDPNLSDTETAQMKLDNVRRIESKYNCKIQFVNLGWQGIMDSINTSIAAGTPECDIYLTDITGFGISAALNKLCQDLTKIAPENSDLFGDQMIVKPMEGLGGTYFFTEQGLPISGMFLGYNATMIQDLGLEDPQQLYKDGNWTWDKFLELAKAGTKDSDGDGTMDVYGYGGVWTNFIATMVLNNGGNIAGAATEALSSKPVTEVLDLVDKLYNKDKSARPWNQDSWDDNLNAWSSGKVLFWTAQAWSLRQEADKAVAAGAELPFEYHIVPYPVGPSGDKSRTISPVSGNWYMIPVGVKEPEKVLQIFEEFLDWFGSDTSYRDDGQWFESCFQSQEDVDLAYQTGKDLELDPWGSLTPYYDLGSSVFFPIAVTADKTVAQAVEAAKPQLQSALDYFWGEH